MASQADRKQRIRCENKFIGRAVHDEKNENMEDKSLTQLWNATLLVSLSPPIVDTFAKFAKGVYLAHYVTYHGHAKCGKVWL
jgi:hypothetical protein